ncbi:hypothetical protein SACE_6194 [Saccharopolyspora erythraea NRRL 2338]|uniref:Uncharacterized protein n=1 Tax=Saccharopolyspora erythraea (strain ATCC 11635 / DSM 40517 / JCM 4748 / NBRC 13426 / NCIMB 8594 / NRRL 2338) TaxID=405948 RepID=A4FMU2_SACEN|nr:hypothetical protein N599_20055 [Saccharopolyspora erythraea D]CAM05367.1 hypothetical protein SACE_6194 [Saccharopolyspora erythraea NRRL 2338]
MPDAAALAYSAESPARSSPTTPRISSCQTSRSGNTSTTGRPARAPTSVISEAVASSTSWPAALAAQTSGTTGSISP